MPSHYAHYQFGRELIKAMPKELKDIINANGTSIDAYTVGLQGPDPLYFYNPYYHGPLNIEASKIHHHSGMDFFGPACDYASENSSPETLSYLLGAIAHYDLDSTVHPMVIKYQKDRNITHQKVERDLDNYLIASQGRDPLYLDLDFIIPRSEKLGAVCSPFYRTTNPRRMNSAINQMRRSLGMMQADSKTVRNIEYGVLSAIPVVRKTRDMIVRDDRFCTDEEYLERNEAMTNALHGAVNETVQLMHDTLNAMKQGQNLPVRYIPDYLGKMH